MIEKYRAIEKRLDAAEERKERTTQFAWEVITDPEFFKSESSKIGYRSVCLAVGMRPSYEIELRKFIRLADFIKRKGYELTRRQNNDTESR